MRRMTINGVGRFSNMSGCRLTLIIHTLSYSRENNDERNSRVARLDRETHISATKQYAGSRFKSCSPRPKKMLNVFMASEVYPIVKVRRATERRFLVSYGNTSRVIYEYIYLN